MFHTSKAVKYPPPEERNPFKARIKKYGQEEVETYMTTAVPLTATMSMELLAPMVS